MALLVTAISLGATGIGLQAKGQHEAGKAAKAQSKSENAWQQYNADIKEREAVEAQNAAAHEERKTRKAGARDAARKRTQFAKAGVSGISKDLLEEEQFSEVELDALTIRRGGTVAAKGLQASAQLSRSAGRASLLRGKAARKAGTKAAIAGTVGGLGSLALSAKKAGA